MHAPGLPGIAPPAKRGRGRPKGSTNKRAKDVREYINARFGGTAAQQSASLCMITPAELKAADGSMAKAQVNKALDLVRHVRDAQDGRDQALRALIREELDDLAASLPGAEAKAVREAVAGFIRKVKEATAGFGLRDALDLITKERASLLPYTDQRLAQVDVTTGGEKVPQAVIVLPPDPMGDAMGYDDETLTFQPVIDGEAVEVSQTKSHDGQQTLVLPGLEDDQPSDTKSDDDA